MALDPMTPEEAAIHADRELEIKAEIEALKLQLRNSEYRTKTEKMALSNLLQTKRTELRVHLGLPTYE
jgi:hypothetical protein